MGVIHSGDSLEYIFPAKDSPTNWSEDCIHKVFRLFVYGIYVLMVNRLCDRSFFDFIVQSASKLSISTVLPIPSQLCTLINSSGSMLRNSYRNKPCHIMKVTVVTLHAGIPPTQRKDTCKSVERAVEPTPREGRLMPQNDRYS